MERWIYSWKQPLKLLLAMLSSHERVGAILLVGRRHHRGRVAEALAVLRERAPARLQVIEGALDVVIVGSDQTHVQADLPPGLVRLGTQFVDGAQPYQLAAYLCHAALHCQLYVAAKRDGRGRPARDAFYEGEAERRCVELEVDVLRELGATEAECDWVWVHLGEDEVHKRAYA